MQGIRRHKLIPNGVYAYSVRGNELVTRYGARNVLHLFLAKPIIVGTRNTVD